MGDFSRVRALFRCLGPAEKRQWLVLLPLTLAVALVEALVTAFVLVALRMLFDANAVIPAQLVAVLPGAITPDADAAWVLPVAGLAILFLLKNAVLILASWSRGKVVNDTEARLSTRLLATCLGSPYARLRDRDSAEMMRNVLGSAIVACATLAACLALATNLLVGVAVLLVVMANAPGASLVAASFFIVAAALMVALLRRRISRWGSDAHDVSRSLLESLRDTLGALKDIKLLHREGYFLERFSAQRRALADIQRGHAFVCAGRGPSR